MKTGAAIHKAATASVLDIKPLGPPPLGDRRKTQRGLSNQAHEERPESRQRSAAPLVRLPEECSLEEVRRLPADLALETAPEMVRPEDDVALAGLGSLTHQPLHLVG